MPGPDDTGGPGEPPGVATPGSGPPEPGGTAARGPSSDSPSRDPAPGTGPSGPGRGGPELLVVAVGGNALLQRGQPVDMAVQRANVAVAAGALAQLAARYRLVVTHGNGPQVGVLAEQAGLGPTPVPLDVLDAETQGQIGYQLELELRNRLPGRELASLLTQVEVDPSDPAFTRPTKPIGPLLDDATARQRVRELGWTVTPDPTRPGAWRRVVASPQPHRTLERAVIALLVDAGVLVISSGGGGIPVARTIDGGTGGAAASRWRGVEAVVDKDRAAALLALELDASALVILTDVAGVHDHWGRPDAELIRSATVTELRARRFDPGSMGPKVDAACTFTQHSGRPAFIGAMASAPALLAGQAGTRVEP